MTVFDRAPEVAEIVDRLCNEVEDHEPLQKTRIESIWRDKAKVSRGRTVLATASKVGGRAAFLVNSALGLVDSNEPFFVLEVASDTWGVLSEDQRVALIDHELCHMRCEENIDVLGGPPVLSIRGHDVEEFAAIIRRRGVWKPDLARFANVLADQLTFDLDDPSGFADGGEA